jgi:hypothetical protein
MTPTVGMMGRKLDVDYLVMSTQIAQLLGAKRLQHVHWWLEHDTSFPRPVVRLGSVHVWYWPEVARWAIKAGRIPKGSDRDVPAEVLAAREAAANRPERR